MAFQRLRPKQALEPAPIVVVEPYKRILRVTEPNVATGETSHKTQEFVVVAEYLKVSSVWEPLAGDDPYMTSDDNIIPCQDIISEFRDLVSWLTRETKFKITSGNMYYLAKLADKYDIPHLRNDLEMFTLTFLVGERPFSTIEASLSLWIFAARNSFIQLESCCWKDSKIKSEVINILANKEQKGLVHFVRSEGISLAFMSDVVSRIIAERGYNW